MSPVEKYYAVILLNNEQFLKTFSTPTGLAEFLQGLPPNAEGYCFLGERLFVTEAPFRYLVIGGDRLPLFKQATPGKIDKSSGLGQAAATHDPLSAQYRELMSELLTAETDSEAVQEPPMEPASGLDQPVE